MPRARQQSVIKCACGCGVTRNRYNARGRLCRYIRGHNPKSPEARAKIAASKIGSRNPQWKGDGASVKTGRNRAWAMYKNIGSCTNCGNAKAERHHIDGNTLNNAPTNIEIVCRKCHMAHDGRLNKLQERNCIRSLRAKSDITTMGGDPSIHKVCKTCRKLLIKDAFHTDRTGWDGRRAACRKCINKKLREVYRCA